MPVRMLTYAEVRERCSGTCHLLLGNGFSIACDPVFRYSSLYDAAVTAGLSDRAQQVFQRLGTSNFEGVLRVLDSADWVSGLYGAEPRVGSDIRWDAEIVKETLIRAVTNSHLAHVGLVTDDRKDAAKAFFVPYKNVFTTNYDLLPYWVNMHGEGPPPFQDGFRSDEDDPDGPHVVFSERLGNTPGLFYIHGALHFFIRDGSLCKHCWRRTGTPLIELIRAGLAAGDYPLFIAEGAAERKLEQVQRVGYLWYALDKLSKIESPLVVFGHSLGESDRHIAEAIADNLKVRQLYVGLHGDPESPENVAIRDSVDRVTLRREARLIGQRRSPKIGSLTVEYYASESARPWG